MKTILYNPIFINPQAYYVFPQLYDIEKGDSFIEPAVYSGYLIIEDLISNTSSQVINTKEVDFTEFAGKRIKISQYTNIGAVVLGEWLLPEGEQSGPSFHQSLVDAWFMSGPSNSDKPGSITGVNGNDIVLKNFAYSLSSGFGKYEVDFINLFTPYPGHKDYIVFTPEKIEIIENLNSIFLNLNSRKEIPSYKVQVFGVINPYSLKYRYFDKEGNYLIFNLPNDGIYTIPKSYLADDNRSIGFIVSNYKNSKGITITQLPSAYEGGLVFDGVDDYGICTGLPILDDYTVICRREWIKKENVLASKRIISNHWENGAFSFERYNQVGNETTFSYGRNTAVTFPEAISYQTANSYNGMNLNRGTSEDTDQLVLGCAVVTAVGHAYDFANCAIYYFALYNKSLTPEEIETEKERLNEEWLKRKTE